MHRLLLISLCLATTEVLAHPEKGKSWDGFGTRTELAWGLLTVMFETPAGKVAVTFPDEPSAGTRYCGSVVLRGTGADDGARAAGVKRLQSATLLIDGEPCPLPDIRNRYVRSAGDQPVRVTLDVEGRHLEAIAVLRFEPASDASSGEGATLPTAGSGACPDAVQQGYPVRIAAPPVDDPSAWTVTAGGEPVALAAATAKEVIFRCPVGPAGPRTVQLNHPALSAPRTCTVRSVGMDLSVRKITLHTGASTALGVTVKGLAGLQHPVFISIVNGAPGAIVLEGGDAQVFTVDPAQAGPDGNYSFTRTITGVLKGSFPVTVSLLPEPGEPQDPCARARACREETGGRAPRSARDPRAQAKACERALENMAGKDYTLEREDGQTVACLRGPEELARNLKPERERSVIEQFRQCDQLWRESPRTGTGMSGWLRRALGDRAGKPEEACADMEARCAAQQAGEVSP